MKICNKSINCGERADGDMCAVSSNAEGRELTAITVIRTFTLANIKREQLFAYRE